MFQEKIIFALFYKWKYLIAILQSKFLKRAQNDLIKSITFVARQADQDWIFGAKVRRLAKCSSLVASPYFHDRLLGLPDSDGYFFVFHQYFYRAMRHNPKILNKKNIVMFTHPNWTLSFSKRHVIWCLNKADKVVFLNSNIQKKLIASGLDAEKTALIPMGSSPNFFYPHKRETGSVGFCSAYSERKNPEMVFRLVKNMPNRKFYLIGRYWEQYERYNEMRNMSNFIYYNNEAYSRYPELYDKIDIFISPSILD